MKMKRFILGLAASIFFASAGLTWAEPVFELDPLKDGILLGTGITLSGSDLILDNLLEVNRQEYDGRIYSKDDVNAFDSFFMHSYSEIRDKSADFTLVAAAASPLLLLIPEGSSYFSRKDVLTYTVMYAETLLIANGIKELTKLGVNRVRPYMYYENSDKPEDDISDGDFANSFPSGHSTIAFASASFTSYTFCRQFPDSKWKIPVVALSYGLASTTAVLRVSSGNHFVTDVLAGAALGSLTGILVPWLHQVNINSDMTFSLLPNGFYVKCSI